jgi:hypothetical protein
VCDGLVNTRPGKIFSVPLVILADGQPQRASGAYPGAPFIAIRTRLAGGIQFGIEPIQPIGLLHILYFSKIVLNWNA